MREEEICSSELGLVIGFEDQREKQYSMTGVI